LKNEKLN